jgi:hypothetical protein
LQPDGYLISGSVPAPSITDKFKFLLPH